MIVEKISIDGDKIRDWESFHAEFANVFGFPSFYGKNMDAWIDCMTSLDCPEDAMSAVHCDKGSIMTIELVHASDVKRRCPEIFDTLLECSGFVNRRRLDVGESAVIELIVVD